jgi:hypothetical protein
MEARRTVAGRMDLRRMEVHTAVVATPGDRTAARRTVVGAAIQLRRMAVRAGISTAVPDRIAPQATAQAATVQEVIVREAMEEDTAERG